MAERLKHCTCNPEASRSSLALTVSWICSQQSRVQIFGHTCKIANWFVSYQLGFLNILMFYLIYCSITPEKPHKGERIIKYF